MKGPFSIGWVVFAGLLLGSCARRVSDAVDAEREALHAMQEFYRVFNEADNEALQEYMNFPHLFIGRNGRISISEERWTIDFDRMREREGWDRSALDSAEAVFVTEDKVHFRIVFSRLHADGTVYRTVPGVWVVTKQDGHWGVQLRSY